MNKTSHTIILFLVMLMSVLLTEGFAIAQQTDIHYGVPEIESFNKRDYCAGSQNWSICQGDNDMMYFANNDGLLEYDGAYWRTYNDSIPWIFRSLLYTRKRVYIGAYNNIGYYSKSKHRQMQYTSIALADSISNLEEYWSIVEFNGCVIFQSQTALLISDGDKIVDVIRSKSHFLSMFMVGGRLFVGDEGLGLLEYINGKLSVVDSANPLSGIYISAMMQLDPQRILICTRAGGLFTLSNRKIEQWNVPANAKAVTDDIFCGITLSDGTIALGTIQGGIFVTDESGEVLSIIDKKHGLPNNTVLSLFEDRHANLWAGLDNGIARISVHSDITFLQNSYNIGTGYCMARHNGYCYFGTNQGLYAIKNETLASPTKSQNDFVRIPGTNGQVWCLKEIDGHLFCGHDKGAFEIISPYEARHITPADVRGVWNFIKINDSIILSGTYYGLTKFTNNQGKWAWGGNITGFAKSGQRIQLADDGSLWLTHGNRGVFRIWFDQTYSKAKKVRSYDDFIGKVGDKVVVCRAANEITFCTDKGLFRYNEGLKQFEPFDKLRQMIGENVNPQLIVTDDYNNVWYFCKEKMGMLRNEGDAFAKIEDVFVVLRNRLMAGYEFALTIDSCNTFVGMENGFAHFKTGNTWSYPTDFSTHIRNAASTNDTLLYDIDAADDTTFVLHYSYSKNSIVVNYASTYFCSAAMLYSTMVEGLDDDWTPWSNRTTRELAKLHEGEYVVHVKAINPFGVVSNEVTLPIIIDPPFYRSMTMKIIIVLLILICGTAAVWYSNQRVKISQKREEERQRARFERESETLKRKAIEQEAELIKMRNEKLENDSIQKEKELANRTLNIIKNNEMMSDVKALLTKAKDEHDTDTLRREIRKIIGKIDTENAQSQQWQLFETHFENVHKEFFVRLAEKYPTLTKREMKLCAYIRMGMSSKEIASLTNITHHAVENNRSHLRAKLNIDKGALKDYLQSI